MPLTDIHIIPHVASRRSVAIKGRYKNCVTRTVSAFSVADFQFDTTCQLYCSENKKHDTWSFLVRKKHFHSKAQLS